MPKSLGYSGVVETRVHFEGDEFITEDIQHGPVIQAILDQNQADRSMGPNRRALGRHAGRIPLTLLDSWRKEWERKHSDKWEWKTFLVMRMNDRDYSYLRTGVDKL